MLVAWLVLAAAGLTSLVGICAAIVKVVRGFRRFAIGVHKLVHVLDELAGLPDAVHELAGTVHGAGASLASITEQLADHEGRLVTLETVEPSGG